MDNNYLIIIQARMGSNRFPGKSLYTFNGRESLGLMIDSLYAGGFKGKIIIAVADTREDQGLVDFCQKEGIDFIVGSEDNVAERFLNIIKKYNPDFFVRLCGDSPLLDYHIVSKTIEVFQKFNPDIASTAFPEKYVPSGMNVEAVNSQLFLKEYNNFELDDFEHVTKYFYRYGDKFKIQPVKFNLDLTYRRCKFSFDTKEDLEVIQGILSKINKPHYRYTLEQKCKIYLGLYNER